MGTVYTLPHVDINDANAILNQGIYEYAFVNNSTNVVTYRYLGANADNVYIAFYIVSNRPGSIVASKAQFSIGATDVRNSTIFDHSTGPVNADDDGVGGYSYHYTIPSSYHVAAMPNDAYASLAEAKAAIQSRIGGIVYNFAVTDISSSQLVVDSGKLVVEGDIPDSAHYSYYYMATDTPGVQMAAYMSGAEYYYIACNTSFNMRFVTVKDTTINYDSGIINIDADNLSIDRYSRLFTSPDASRDNQIFYINLFNNESECLEALRGGALIPITYRLTNCTAPDAPSSALHGSTVTVTLNFTEGFGLVNASDAYVMNNGVLIPSSVANNVLTFTMP